MKPSKGRPSEPDRTTEPDTLPLTNPKTGKKIKVEDRRTEFEKITKQTPRDIDGEIAFIEGKMQMVLTDSHLTDEEKKQAIEELKRKLPNP
jgi:hypothetical protein